MRGQEKRGVLQDVMQTLRLGSNAGLSLAPQYTIQVQKCPYRLTRLVKKVISV